MGGACRGVGRSVPSLGFGGSANPSKTFSRSPCTRTRAETRGSCSCSVWKRPSRSSISRPTTQKAVREEEPERRTSRSSRTRSANASRGCRTTSNSVPGESRTSSKSLGTSASGPRRTTARSGSEFESEWKGPPVGTETRLLVLSRDFLGSSRRLLRPNLAPEPAKSCASAPLDAIPWESRRGRRTSDFAEGLLCCAARCPSASTDFARPMGPRIQGEAQDRRPPGRHAGPGPT